jgi:ferredoxin
MIRIEIDGDKCVGSGNCVFWAPGTFDLDDDGHSVVVDPTGDSEDRIRVAAEGCPANAISVVVVEPPGSGSGTGPGSASQEQERQPERQQGQG